MFLAKRSKCISQWLQVLSDCFKSREILPNLHQSKLLQQRTIRKFYFLNSILRFRCIKTSTPEAEQIVLEDLSKKGFKMASRHLGLDMDHVKLVIERLSKFHAASAVFQENNGPYSDTLLEGMYNDKLKPMMETYFNSNLNLLKEVVGTFPNGDRYLKQMVNFELCTEIRKFSQNFSAFRKII